MDETPETPPQKKPFIHRLSNSVIIACCVIIIFLVGFRFGQRYSREDFSPNAKYSVQNLKEGNKKNLDFSLFWETWNTIEANYIDRSKLNPQKLYYGAIKGMVASLNDSYTYFLTPEEYKQSKDDLHGTFEGIGAELGLKQGQIVIVTPIKDSPAEKAGAKPGDVIIKVDNKKTDEWTLQEAVSKIRGPRGKKVVLTVFRPSTQEEKDLTVTRDKINIKFVELSYENGIAIIKLSRFGDDTVRLWNESVQNIASKINNGKLKGVVLDLRNNPGGFLDGAVYISSEFLTVGDVIVKQEYSDKKEDIYKSERTGELLGVPLTVLINEGSASASEIVAGALRDNKKATLVGEKSFGKGTVQQVFDLSHNAGIHVTISRWVLPNGDWIHDKGVKPNVTVKNPTDDKNTVTRDTDKQLDKAIEIINDKTKK